ncbi:MAG: VWA domain-containing protein [Candidatus Gracilibacteria bacterium]|nr:VWA domain-containing protein [Candidatus Gracilibacteria bacterium]
MFSYILIFANPNIDSTDTKTKKSGIDIVLALDISYSMNATDLAPNRIEAAKKVITDFISKQETNRVGLVVFAGKPFTSIPLTFDYNILKETISNLKTDNINQNLSLAGTAIGDAILMSETLFENKDDKNIDTTKDREKVIILLTDGDANTGVDPQLAAKNSKEENIKIYTIGIGSPEGGTIVYNTGPFQQVSQVPPLNGEALQSISKTTSGEFFKATDNRVFEEIFKKLESLDKKEIEVETKNIYNSNYTYFVYILGLLLFVFMFYTFRKPEIKNNFD